MARIKMLVGVGIIVLLASVTGCRSSSQKVKPVLITIKECESYEISDLNELDASLNCTYTSSDESVADVREGKYIYGLSDGETTIVVDDGDSKTTYEVTVEPDDADRQSVIDEGSRDVSSDDWETPDNDIYIGCGYNVLDGKEINENTINKGIEHEIFDWEKVYWSGKLYKDNSVVTETNCYSGTSRQSFVDSYSKKTTVSVSVKFWKYTLYKKNKEITESTSVSQNDIKSINQLYQTVTYAKYIFKENMSSYWDYVYDDVKKKLLGTDGTTVEEFIQQYGTHVLLAGSYGGSFQYNFIDSNSKNCVVNSRWNSAESINRDFISGALFDMTQNHGLAAEYDGFGWAHDYDFDSLLVVIGGLFPDTHIGYDLGMSILTYQDWYMTLNPSKSQLIGPMDDQSLYPVWELIPTDTEEGAKRKEEFIKYMKDNTEIAK